MTSSLGNRDSHGYTTKMSILRHLSTMVSKVLVIFMISIHISEVVSNGVEVREYCLNYVAVFNASCPPGSVIYMQVARHGRMHIGNCVKTDRDLNCYTDELPYMHGLCSGRSRCELRIPDKTLQDRYPCDKELHTYLEAGYTCQRAILPNQIDCLHKRPMAIQQYPGYIGSFVAASPLPAVNPRSCLYELTAGKGQQIKLTLFDFKPAQSYVTAGDSCVLYAKVRDGTTGTEQAVCAGLPGEREILTSTGNSVRIEMTAPTSEEDKAYFLLKYELTGCADPRVPGGTSLSRHGNSATITCNVTSQTWHIICQDNKWVGRIDNCTKHADRVDASKRDKTSNEWSVGLVVAILIGIVIGVVLGLLCLTTVTCVYKRGSFNRNYENPLPRATPEHVHMLNASRDQGYECAHTLQRQYPPQSNDANTMCPYHSLRYTHNEQQSTYEKPSLIKDCETCVDDHVDGCQGHHGLIDSYPEHTLRTKRYLQIETVIPYNTNDNNQTMK